MRKSALHIAISVAFIGTLIGGEAQADVILSGPDSNAGVYSAADLSSVATSSDTYSANGLTGISLWGLLGGAAGASPTATTYGAITTSTPAGDNGKNALLRYYVVATGAGGAQSVISLGEIDPSFGGTAAIPALVAYQTSGGALLASPELIVPGEPGRNLDGLTSLQLLAVPALPTGTGGVSNAVQLSGAVTAPGRYNQTALANDFTPVTETISGDTYTGVPLYTFLDPNDPNITSQIVVAQATDGYEVVFSLAELDPVLGGNLGDLLPYADTGGNFPIDGVARTIVPTDNKQGRWVSNLDAVIVTEVPEPNTLTLMVVGLVVLAAAKVQRWRARSPSVI